MAIAFVNSCSGAGSLSGVTSSAMDTTGANLIVVSVATYSSLGANLTDSQSNTWTSLTTASPNRAKSRLFYCINPTTSSSHTFTFSQSGTYPSISAVAFSGVAAYESENTSTQTGLSTTIQTGSVTPSKDGSLVFAGACTDGGIYTAVDSGFTLETSVSHVSAQHMGSASAYLIQTTAAAVNPQFTNSVSDYLSASIAVFKPAKTGLGDEKLWLCPSLDDSAGDISGNGNHGTYNGGMGTVADTSNGGTRAYSFDGVNDYIETPFILNPASGDFSCTGWAMLDSTASSIAVIAQQLGSGGRAWLYRDGNALASYLGGTLTSSANHFTSSTHGVFQHFALVYSGTNLKLYVNGTEEASATISAGSEPSSGMKFGSGKTTYYWKGLQDDIRIFDRALTTSEITALASKRGYEVPAASASSGSTPHPLSAPIFHPLG